jgi:hypothetical protein
MKYSLWTGVTISRASTMSWTLSRELQISHGQKRRVSKFYMIPKMIELSLSTSITLESWSSIALLTFACTRIQRATAVMEKEKPNLKRFLGSRGAIFDSLSRSRSCMKNSKN